MNFTKTSLASAIAVSLGTVGYAGTATAGSLNLTFADNTNPSTTQTNTLVQFSAGTEFHVVTPYGTGINDGDKDVFSGGETWSFGSTGSSIVGALLTGVSNMGTNSGGTGAAAVLTTGVTGFPVATTAGTIANMQNQASFLQPTNFFTMAAAVQGGTVASTFGTASVTAFTSGSGGTLSINIPVVYTQWATGTYIIGGDPNANPTHGDKCSANGPCGGPGVTLTGTVDGAGNFTLYGSYKMTKDEVSVLGFNNNTVEWELVGSYSASAAAVPVPAAVWLFGSGLLGLVGVARRRRNQV